MEISYECEICGSTTYASGIERVAQLEFVSNMIKREHQHSAAEIQAWREDERLGAREYRADEKSD